MNLCDRIEGGSLQASVACVMTSNSTCKGIQRARERGLTVHVLPRRDYSDKHAFSDAIFNACQESGVDLLCLAGFLSLLVIPDGFTGRVLNIHPSLLPKFGGKGMHGQHVHQAVLDAKESTTGCTVHLADNTYDTGPVLLQKSCEVLPQDTPASLSQRVFELECEAYPQAITEYWGSLKRARPDQA